MTTTLITKGIIFLHPVGFKDRETVNLKPGMSGLVPSTRVESESWWEMQMVSPLFFDRFQVADGGRTLIASGPLKKSVPSEGILGITNAFAENKAPQEAIHVIATDRSPEKDPKRQWEVLEENGRGIRNVLLAKPLVFNPKLANTAVGNVHMKHDTFMLVRNWFEQFARCYNENRPCPVPLLVLVGPPGCGKSFATRWCADAFQIPLRRFDILSVRKSSTRSRSVVSTGKRQRIIGCMKFTKKKHTNTTNASQLRIDGMLSGGGNAELGERDSEGPSLRAVDEALSGMLGTLSNATGAPTLIVIGDVGLVQHMSSGRGLGLVLEHLMARASMIPRSAGIVLELLPQEAFARPGKSSGLKKPEGAEAAAVPGSLYGQLKRQAWCNWVRVSAPPPWVLRRYAGDLVGQCGRRTCRIFWDDPEAQTRIATSAAAARRTWGASGTGRWYEYVTADACNASGLGDMRQVEILLPWLSLLPLTDLATSVADAQQRKDYALATDLDAALVLIGAARQQGNPLGRDAERIVGRLGAFAVWQSASLLRTWLHDSIGAPTHEPRPRFVSENNKTTEQKKDIESCSAAELYRLLLQQTAAERRHCRLGRELLCAWFGGARGAALDSNFYIRHILGACSKRNRDTKPSSGAHAKRRRVIEMDANGYVRSVFVDVPTDVGADEDSAARDLLDESRELEDALHSLGSKGDSISSIPDDNADLKRRFSVSANIGVTCKFATLDKKTQDATLSAVLEISEILSEHDTVAHHMPEGDELAVLSSIQAVRPAIDLLHLQILPAWKDLARWIHPPPPFFRKD